MMTTSSCKVSNNKRNHQGEGGDEQRHRRTWADMCPEILHSIYAKLLPSHRHGTRFGSVCRNWHRLHSPTSKYMWLV
ncbi:unnamed protein product [Linum trigynum]|uniref:F-box domain-containing protein n=1 Tax=Linum trigynum TaxID=586398 RepID=A0AAV2CQM9_9ROSI